MTMGPGGATSLHSRTRKSIICEPIPNDTMDTGTESNSPVYVVKPR
jgi:hypothetical protein